MVTKPFRHLVNCASVFQATMGKSMSKFVNIEFFTACSCCTSITHATLYTGLMSEFFQFWQPVVVRKVATGAHDVDGAWILLTP